ncbi:MAG TPA: hypothetical protein GXZ82_14795 [Firmicutes bacterium]|jgi:cell fate (sporulation/competence/biofilm development) regulator YlbF (YheA/YmcA/DUF963 family)|nr:hypothetical protein [Bacillota bacterium]
MDPRIRVKAEELGKMLAASEEYVALQKARAVLEEHSAAKIMLNDVQKRQEALRNKQMAGEEITDQEIQDFQRATQIVSMNPYVRQMLEAEMSFSRMLQQVQRVLFAPLGIELPEDEPDGAEATEEDAAAAAKKAEEEAAKEARKRLWVPGR